MKVSSTPGTARVTSLVVMTLATFLLPYSVLAGDCSRATDRAQSSSELKLEAYLLKHRPYLVVQQPAARHDSRQ